MPYGEARSIDRGHAWAPAVMAESVTAVAVLLDFAVRGPHNKRYGDLHSVG